MSPSEQRKTQLTAAKRLIKGQERKGYNVLKCSQFDYVVVSYCFSQEV